MMRWIFRPIVMTVAAKLVNRYLGSHHPHTRSRGYIRRVSRIRFGARGKSFTC